MAAWPERLADGDGPEGMAAQPGQAPARPARFEVRDGLV